jgi:hypothetical protein
MRDCSVVRFKPSRAAAPLDPPARRFRFFQTYRIRARSDGSESLDLLLCNATPAGVPLDSGMFTRSSGPLLGITDRSITFCSSRILPGQS